MPFHTTPTLPSRDDAAAIRWRGSTWRHSTGFPVARETVYLVQAFSAGRGSSLKADTPIRCRSADAARRTAERLVPAKAGVVALSSAADAELGEYDEEPTIIFKAGRLPAVFEDA
jgi:hypothetical protein